MEYLCLKHVTKKYNKNAAPALHDFTYEFSQGVYGLLGPNGAGKSTLMKLIVGNLSPTEGEVCYAGKEVMSLGKDYRTVLGFMPQQQQLYDSFTVKRFMYYFAALKGLTRQKADQRIKELLTLVNLFPHANDRLRTLSGGMKQRVLLAQALLNDPKILILDEPTAGLDPKERINIRNYLYSISENRIILLATHVISDIEQVAKEVVFLREGETVLSGTPDQVIRAVSSQIWEVELPGKSYSELNEKYPRNRIVGEKNGIITMKIISDKKPEMTSARQAAVSLEDVYMVLYQ